MAHMNEWLIVTLCSAVTGIAVCILQRILAARKYDQLNKKREEAESSKSKADGELKAKCDEVKRLREDADADLKRQADQFHDEIRALNAKLEGTERKMREVRKMEPIRWASWWPS